MIDEQVEALINEELDGVLPSESRCRFRDALAGNAEARAYYADLKRIRDALAQAALAEETPREIKDIVLQSLPGLHPRWRETAVHPQGESSWFQGLVLAIKRQPVMTGGLVFAAGFALGIATLSAIHPVPTGGDAAVGFMAPIPLQGSVLVASEAIVLPSVNGVIETRITRDNSILHVDLHSEERVEVTVAYDVGSLHLRGFQLAQPDLGDVIVGPNQLRIGHRGNNNYMFVLQKPAGHPDIVVRCRAGGQVLEKRLPTSER